jgi:hypothetical protein
VVDPTSASAFTVVIAPFAPPALLIEAAPPAPGPGWYWIAGHWDWRSRWVWVHGYWTRRPRPSAVWIDGRWVARGGGWAWIDGRWK